MIKYFEKYHIKDCIVSTFIKNDYKTRKGVIIEYEIK